MERDIVRISNWSGSAAVWERGHIKTLRTATGHRRVTI